MIGSENKNGFSLAAAALPAWRATLKNPADIMREQP